MSDQSDGDERDLEELDDDELVEQFGGKPTFPGTTSNTHRRRLLQAMGGASTVAVAGCLGLFDDEEEEPEETPEDTPEDTPDDEDPDDDDDEEEDEYPIPYPELDTFPVDVAPKELVKHVDVQIAFNDEEIIFNFEWEQPDPGGWIHDMIYYDGDEGEWRRLADWDPWVLDQDYGFASHHEGYYEDRLSFLWHDGSLQGFDNFGGWITVMEGVRTLPGAATEQQVVDHPYFGDEGMGRSDMRKFIPQSREGEWWEHPWDQPKEPDELDRMLEDGEYIDFPFWRASRSNPVGYGTNHHVLEYRNGNVTGQDTFTSQSWDPVDGPEYMFDPDVVEGGAVDRADVVDGDGNPNREDMPPVDEPEQYALIEGENMVEFDPDVAEWDGAMIPRRPLREPSESGASWPADGHWEDGTWTVEMRRELDTGYVDDMPVEEGEVYTWAPAIHHGSSQRWHWVAYPHKLGLGVEPEYYGESDNLGNSELVAEKVDGEPDWDDVETYTIPLMYPGMADWTWLTSGEHPRVDDVRNAEITIWEYHDEDPEAFAQRMLELEGADIPRK